MTDTSQTSLTADDLAVWRAFCEWLDARKGKCAYSGDVPEQKWRELIRVGAYKRAQEAKARRNELGLIFYQEGWGWRLRANWRTRLEELEAVKSRV